MTNPPVADHSAGSRTATMAEEQALAELERVRAETAKLHAETRATISARRAEPFKVIAAAILGLGGIIAAITQYEAAELRVEKAKAELVELTASQQTAESLMVAALGRRDSLAKELPVLQAAIESYKGTLAQLARQLRTATQTSASARLVYIQFRGQLSRTKVNELRGALNAASFTSPGAERLDGTYRSEVRFFRDDDSRAADRVRETVEAYLRAKGCPTVLAVVRAQAASSSPPLEVWLSHDCPG